MMTTTEGTETWVDGDGRWHVRVPIREGSAVGTTLRREARYAAFDALVDAGARRGDGIPVLGKEPTEVSKTYIVFSEVK